nr:unnamed protein product [Callosobruchus chinensis]
MSGYGNSGHARSVQILWNDQWDHIYHTHRITLYILPSRISKYAVLL